MTRSKDNVVIALLCVIAVLLVLNLLATRFEIDVVEAGGGGGQQGKGWIAFSGQNTSGPETVFVLNTHKGKPRKTNNDKTQWEDNGPRMAVYRLSGNGKLKFLSMRNIGPDTDEWLDSISIDKTGPSVRDIKEKNQEARDRKTSGEEDDDDDIPVETE